MDCSTPGFPVIHYVSEFAQTQVHWVNDAISSSNALFSSCPQSFPASGFFPVSQLFASGGQSIRTSASASVLPINIQGWPPLGLTSFIPLLLRGLTGSFSSTTVWKHVSVCLVPHLGLPSHFHTELIPPQFCVMSSSSQWLLQKPCPNSVSFHPSLGSQK